MSFNRALTVALIATLLLTAAPDLHGQEELRDVNGLIFDLRHPELDRRKTAVVALGKHRIRRAVPELSRLVKDPDDLLRTALARTLVKISDIRALPALMTLCHDSRKQTQLVAIRGLVSLYVTTPDGFIQGMKRVVGFVNPANDDYNPLIVEPYVSVSPEAIDTLATLLSSPDADIRRNAAFSLGILRGRRGLPALQEALEVEPENGVKVEMIRAIYKIGDPEGGVALIPLIWDPDKKVHDEAIFALGRLKVGAAVPALTELYNSGVTERKRILGGLVPVSRSHDLRRKTLEALAYIGDPRSRAIFLEAITDERTAFRRHGAEGLGRLGDSSLVPTLAPMFQREEDPEVILAVSFALFRLGGEEHLPELVDQINTDQVYFYLLELEPDEVPKLHPLLPLHTRDPAVQVRLLDVIGQRGDASSLEVVEPLTRSENSDVISSANVALRRLQGRHPGATLSSMVVAPGGTGTGAAIPAN
jgi:HEAT repeat protein